MDSELSLISHQPCIPPAGVSLLFVFVFFILACFNPDSCDHIFSRGGIYFILSVSLQLPGGVMSDLTSDLEGLIPK